MIFEKSDRREGGRLLHKNTCIIRIKVGRSWDSVTEMSTQNKLRCESGLRYLWGPGINVKRLPLSRWQGKSPRKQDGPSCAARYDGVGRVNVRV